MYPLALKEKGLITALREYIFEWENRNDIQVELMVEGSDQLTDIGKASEGRSAKRSLEIEQAIYRVTQEALANIARHSRANKVEVQVIYHTDSIEVAITDNGQGFNAAKKSSGMGLLSMRERVEMIHGKLIIESSPNLGTRIIIQTPINRIS
jgi:signal transduction histidine kinase